MATKTKATKAKAAESNKAPKGNKKSQPKPKHQPDSTAQAPATPETAVAPPPPETEEERQARVAREDRRGTWNRYLGKQMQTVGLTEHQLNVLEVAFVTHGVTLDTGTIGKEVKKRWSEVVKKTKAQHPKGSSKPEWWGDTLPTLGMNLYQLLSIPADNTGSEVGGEGEGDGEEEGKPEVKEGDGDI